MTNAIEEYKIQNHKQSFWVKKKKKAINKDKVLRDIRTFKSLSVK